VTSLLSPAAIAFGLALLAGLLWLLQRLRVRHRPVRVPSTLFWKEALEEARARVLVERFRHPLAYLFLLLILATIWLSTAGLDLDRRTGDLHLVLLDGSARMAEPGSFERAGELVRETVAELPRARRQVILAAGEPRTLLAPGEHERLLSLRLAAYAPEAAPSTLDRVLADHLPSLSVAPRATVWVAGGTPLSPALLASLPKTVTVVDLGAASPEGAEREGGADGAGLPRSNRGISALGVAAAESGVWERVDLFIEVTGDLGREGSAELSLTLDGEPVEARAERSSDGAPRTPARTLVLRDLPAAGGRFEAALGGADRNALDDRAARSLPLRPPIRVALSPSLAPRLGPALAADPAVRLVDEGADVAVRRGGESIGGDLPALEFVSRDRQEETFLLTHDAGGSAADSAELLSSALIELGLGEIDAMELAAAAGRPITIGARPAPRGEGGTRRTIGVWEELLGDEYDFVASRSFPLFTAHALRWLTGARDFPAEAAAGRPLAGAGRLAAGGLVLDPVGMRVRPPRVGEYSDERGDGVSIALLDPATSAAEPAVAPPRAAGTAAPDLPEPPGAPHPIASLLAVAALLLLAAEWHLHRRGIVP